MSTAQCLVGKLLETKCGDHKFFKTAIDFKDLTDTDLKNLKYRVPNFPQSPIGTICPLHINNVLVHYSYYQNNCFDPYNKHRIAIKSALRVISLEVCEEFYEVTNVRIPPGKKVCTNCLKTITDTITDWKTKQDEHTVETETNYSPINQQDSQASTISINSLPDNEGSENSCSEPSTSNGSLGFLMESQEQMVKEKKMKRILEAIELPMPKRQKLSSERLQKVGAELADSIFERVVDCINNTFKINVQVSETKALQRDRNSLYSVIENLKCLYNKQTTHAEKIKVLTLFPPEWTYSTIKEHVDCSSYMVRKANLLREKNGVFADPERKKINRFSEELVDSIEDFYRNSSRICSGTKETVTVFNRKTKTKEKLQKKLILCSIRDLYHKWIQDNLDNLERVPGFSFFASLRPKDCKLAGDPGTHTVCVCGEHQNLKLKCRACSFSLEYRKLLNLCVCSVENENCMLNDCSDCPGSKAIRDFLNSQNLIKTSGTITYFNWKSVNIDAKNIEGVQSKCRVTLREVTEDVNTFYDQLIKDIWNLRKHHFISERQKNYCEYAKNNLDYDTGLMMMDFAENYTFIAQDSTQAFYYNNIQATLHPFVLYYRDHDDKVKHASFCVVSDYLKHNAYVVNIFQEKVIQVIKERFPWIKKFIYFSDGAPTQYKNKNAFVNICAHKNDFGIQVESYNFFATSHGKGPCDGIGAVAKRTVREASLVLPPEKSILDPLSMYEFLNVNMTSTKFLWVSSAECEQRQRKLKKRFEAARTIEDTRSYHYLRPIDENRAEFRVISISEKSKVESIIK